MNCARTQALPPHLQDGKIAFADLVDAYGGQEAASEQSGKSQPRISAYCARNTADFPPLDVIDALEARTVGHPGWPHVTSWLCRRRGGVFVPLPTAADAPVSLAELASDLVRAAGKLGPDLIDAGGAPDAAEAWRRLPNAAEVVRIAIQIEHALQQRAAEGD